jgi:hypothetical protein
MSYRYSMHAPERMVVLSIQLPPQRFEPRKPFGFGAFTVARRWRDEAVFSSHAHGYGAGYDPDRMKEDIGKLFTPETTALIHTPAPSEIRCRHAAIPLVSRHLAFIPRSGLVRNIRASITPDELVRAARIGSLEVAPPEARTPLQRLWHIRYEAEAAWLWWLLAGCGPRVRRNLFAAHAAWQGIRSARSRA